MMKFDMVKQGEFELFAQRYAEYYCSVKWELKETPMLFQHWFAQYESKIKNELEDEIDGIIFYLNNNCKIFSKRGFMLKGKKTRSLIRTKLKEGFTMTDHFQVLDAKIDWLEDKSMHKYYRPITLFGNKFEDYLNEKTKPLDKTSDEQFREAISKAATDTY